MLNYQRVSTASFTACPAPLGFTAAWPDVAGVRRPRLGGGRGWPRGWLQRGDPAAGRSLDPGGDGTEANCLGIEGLTII